MDDEKELYFGVFDRFTNKCYFTGELQPAELLHDAKDEVDWDALKLWLKNVLETKFKSNVSVTVGVVEISR